MGAEKGLGPPTLADLKAKHETRTWELEVLPGRELTITYDAFAFTTKVYARMADLQANLSDPEAVEGQDFEDLCELIAGILISWDVTDDAGEMVPPTKERLMDLPFPFLMEVSSHFREEAEENPTNAGPSSEPSRRKGSRARSRRGGR